MSGHWAELAETISAACSHHGAGRVLRLEVEEISPIICEMVLLEHNRAGMTSYPLARVRGPHEWACLALAERVTSWKVDGR